MGAFRKAIEALNQDHCTGESKTEDLSELYGYNV